MKVHFIHIITNTVSNLIILRLMRHKTDETLLSHPDFASYHSTKNRSKCKTLLPWIQ